MVLTDMFGGTLPSNPRSRCWTRRVSSCICRAQSAHADRACRGAVSATLPAAAAAAQEAGASGINVASQPRASEC